MIIKLKKNNTPKKEGMYLCKSPIYSDPEFVSVRNIYNPFIGQKQLDYVSRTSTFPMERCKGRKLLWSDELTITGGTNA